MLVFERRASEIIIQNGGVLFCTAPIGSMIRGGLHDGGTHSTMPEWIRAANVGPRAALASALRSHDGWL